MKSILSKPRTHRHLSPDNMTAHLHWTFKISNSCSLPISEIGLSLPQNDGLELWIRHNNSIKWILFSCHLWILQIAIHYRKKIWVNLGSLSGTVQENWTRKTSEAQLTCFQLRGWTLPLLSVSQSERWKSAPYHTLLSTSCSDCGGDGDGRSTADCVCALDRSFQGRRSETSLLAACTSTPDISTPHH